MTRDSVRRIAPWALLSLLAVAPACGGKVLEVVDDTPDGSTPVKLRVDAGITTPADASTAKPPVDSGPSLDNGMPSDVYPAPHPALPQVIASGGPVLTAPVIVPIFFPNDSLQKPVESFIAAIGSSDYWTTATKAYGIGPATAGTSVVLTEGALLNTSGTDIETWLTAKLDGTHPEFGVPTANTLYVIYYPASTTISDPGDGTSCQDYGGYHDEITLANGVEIPFAVMPRCDGIFPGLSGLQTLTYASSHEFIEAASDPLPYDHPAYELSDADHLVWAGFPATEIGDMCVDEEESDIAPAALGFTVQRIWSNAAAAADQDPCIPVRPGEAYFNSAPVMTDDVNIDLSSFYGMLVPPTTTKGVRMAVGESRTIEIDLFSTASTGGPWDVQVFDVSAATGQGDPTLDLSLDRTSGQNGEKLHLTITRLSEGPFGGSEFVLMSQLGQRSSVWAGYVGD